MIKDNTFACVALLGGIMLIMTGHASAGIILWGVSWMTYKG